MGFVVVIFATNEIKNQAGIDNLCLNVCLSQIGGAYTTWSGTTSSQRDSGDRLFHQMVFCNVTKVDRNSAIV